MTIDQVVAALTAEGYSRDSIHTVMDALAEADWRDEEEDWSQKDLTTLRRQLGTPAIDSRDEHSADEPDDTPTEGQNPRSDAEVWAADLARVLERTTGGKTPLNPDQIRRVADHLLRWSDGPLDPETDNPRIEGSSYLPDFSVTRWADGLDEAIRVGTNGAVELSRVELQVAANLLLHAQEDDWVPQAALLRTEHQPAPDDIP